MAPGIGTTERLQAYAAYGMFQARLGTSLKRSVAANP
jgi:hypothetical protein